MQRLRHNFMNWRTCGCNFHHSLLFCQHRIKTHRIKTLKCTYNIKKLVWEAPFAFTSFGYLQMITDTILIKEMNLASYDRNRFLSDQDSASFLKVLWSSHKYILSASIFFLKKNNEKNKIQSNMRRIISKVICYCKQQTSWTYTLEISPFKPFVWHWRLGT